MALRCCRHDEFNGSVQVLYTAKTFLYAGRSMTESKKPLAGIGVDYSNICKDYNTSYLDRDNKDPATMKCMKAVTLWMKSLLQQLQDRFGLSIYNLQSGSAASVDEIASNRFLFYSLEKEITLQSYVLQDSDATYDTASDWVDNLNTGMIIRNDEDGEGVYFYAYEDSPLLSWLHDRLQTFSLDEVEFNA